jgi:hypothetical protein
VSKSATIAVADVEGVNKLKLSLSNWHEDHLRNTISWLDDKDLIAAIPARHHDLSLIITVNQTDEIPKHNTVFVAKA